MRIKTLVLTAALVAAGALSSVAQSNVYSLNVVGYINLSLNSGYTLIANQLDADGTGTNNTLASVFSTNAPSGTSVLAWSSTLGGFNSAVYRKGSWSGDTVDVTTGLQPGYGVFVDTGSAATITIVGTVMQAGSGVAITYPAGYSILSSQAPLSGGVATTLGYPAASGDSILVWDATLNSGAGGYDSYIFRKGSWTPSEPQIAVGESFFVNVGTGNTWTNTFVVQ